MTLDDYDIPFDGMSEEEFLYRAMNEDDPMYMGPTYVEDNYIEDDYIEDDYISTETDDDYNERVAEWYDTPLSKKLITIKGHQRYTTPKTNDIDCDPYPEQYY